MANKQEVVAAAQAELDKKTAAARKAGERYSEAAPKEAELHKRLHHGQEARLAWICAAGEAAQAHQAATEAEEERAEAQKKLEAAQRLPS